MTSERLLNLTKCAYAVDEVIDHLIRWDGEDLDTIGVIQEVLDDAREAIFADARPELIMPRRLFAGWKMTRSSRLGGTTSTKYCAMSVRHSFRRSAKRHARRRARAALVDDDGGFWVQPVLPLASRTDEAQVSLDEDRMYPGWFHLDHGHHLADVLTALQGE